MGKGCRKTIFLPNHNQLYTKTTMTEKFQNKYRVPSARAPWHGYNGGVYFVTICTQNREHYFGEITCDCRDVVTASLRKRRP